MRKIYYDEKWKKLLTPEIVSLLTTIHEFKGEQTVFVERYGNELEQLAEATHIQSVEAFNSIEGIYICDERLKLIALDKTMPKTRKEFEIAGYRDVLNTINYNYEHIPIKSSIILNLHRDLNKFNVAGIGGKYKENGDMLEMINELCDDYDEITRNELVDPLLVIPMFILDFMCIHPFGDDNGRMSRLLTSLLLYRAGYLVGKYISVEKLMENLKDTYYEAVQASSKHWHKDENNYEPFVRFMLGIISNAYLEFFARIRLSIMNGLSKPEHVREIIKETLGTITKTEIMKKCPNISQITIQRTLADLLAKGEIVKIGGGRYTKYTWNWSRGDE
ncbi:MAG: Fic family protein [Tyzzerella sp.]|nr:Fic family protein [Tyzzerella sp.]